MLPSTMSQSPAVAQYRGYQKPCMRARTRQDSVLCEVGRPAYLAGGSGDRPPIAALPPLPLGIVSEVGAGVTLGDARTHHRGGPGGAGMGRADWEWAYRVGDWDGRQRVLEVCALSHMCVCVCVGVFEACAN